MYILADWKYGDWRNWKRYYPTILFYICVNLGISYLTYDFPLWRYSDKFLNSHKITDYIHTIISFPALLFLYLSNLPLKSSRFKQIVYILCFVIILCIIEAIFRFAKEILYFNGWNYWWSVLVWLFMFIGVRLHYTKPLWAWLLCFVCTAFLIFYFHIPMKS
ncbi:CBO0543 family protein [Bacillus sp. USDA818B3_A]|uniref:CBO0543 family protein n=1 Tax=Bacillus sp. USDA818B3_A TaxID=2698834 RepID=UPI003FA4601C